MTRCTHLYLCVPSMHANGYSPGCVWASITSLHGIRWNLSRPYPHVSYECSCVCAQLLMFLVIFTDMNMWTIHTLPRFVLAYYSPSRSLHLSTKTRMHIHVYLHICACI